MDCGTHVLLRLMYPAIDTSVIWMPGGAMAAAGADHYQWVDCDAGMSPIAGANTAQFLPAAIGNYAVMITANDCAVFSSCHLIDPDQPTGIVVYPNPVQDMLYVDLLNNHANAGFTLFDRMGRMVMNGRFDRSPGVLDMRSLAAGIYVLEVRAGGVMRYKIVR
jgi:hypothetical protein